MDQIYISIDRRWVNGLPKMGHLRWFETDEELSVYLERCWDEWRTMDPDCPRLSIRLTIELPDVYVCEKGSVPRQMTNDELQTICPTWWT